MDYYDPNDDTILSNHFDPYNKQHIKAWSELRRTGVWPKWFYNGLAGKGISIDYSWDRVIRMKMADAWVKYVMEDVEGTSGA